LANSNSGGRTLDSNVFLKAGLETSYALALGEPKSDALLYTSEGQKPGEKQVENAAQSKWRDRADCLILGPQSVRNAACTRQL
jgi:hypothetical protein